MFNMVPLVPQFTRKGNFCVACKSSSSKSHHVFPKEESLRNKWIDILCLRAEDIKSNSRICGEHFSRKCFSKAATQRAYLLPGSLPNPMPKYSITMSEPVTLNKEVCGNEPGDTSTSYRVPVFSECLIPPSENASKGHIEINTATSTEMVATQDLSCDSVTRKPAKRICYVGDVEEVEDFSTPEKFKKNFDIMKKTVQRQKLQIRTLQQCKRRLQKKISSLQEILCHLKSENLISKETE